MSVCLPLENEGEKAVEESEMRRDVNRYRSSDSVELGEFW